MDAVEPSYGQTPLHMAVLRKNVPVAKTLLDLGADMHHKAHNKISPYMLSQAVSDEMAALFQARAAALTQVSPEAQLGYSLQHILQSMTGNLVEGVFQGFRRNMPDPMGLAQNLGNALGRGVVGGAASAAAQHAPQFMGIAEDLGNSLGNGAFSSLEKHKDALREAAKEFGLGLKAGIGNTQFKHELKHRFCTIQ